MHLSSRVLLLSGGVFFLPFASGRVARLSGEVIKGGGLMRGNAFIYATGGVERAVLLEWGALTGGAGRLHMKNIF